MAEHEALLKEHARLKGAPHDHEGHQSHMAKLHDHTARLHSYAVRLHEEHERGV